jgi:hypothetical protein
MQRDDPSFLQIVVFFFILFCLSCAGEKTISTDRCLCRPVSTGVRPFTVWTAQFWDFGCTVVLLCCAITPTVSGSGHFLRGCKHIYDARRMDDPNGHKSSYQLDS